MEKNVTKNYNGQSFPNNQPSSLDIQHEQSVRTTIAANKQEEEMKRWKVLQDTQTKASERQQDVTVNQKKTKEKMFDHWQEYIRGSVNAPNTPMLASTSAGAGYQVGSYEDMDEGVRTVKTMGEDLHTELASNDSMSYLKQDRAFIGPIADHFFDVADLYNKTTDRNISDLESNSRTLAQINTNYQNTDAEAQSKMGGLVS